MAEFDDLLGAAMAPEEEAAVDEPDPAAPEADAVEPEPAAEANDPWAAYRDEYGEFIQQHGFKDVADVLKKAAHQDRLISQGAHKQPEPQYEEPEQDAPLDIPLPLGGEPLTQGELEAWATESPKDAAMWALQREGLQPVLRDAVVRHWATQNPDEFTEYKLEQRLQGFQSQLQQTLAPQMAFVQQQQTQLFAQTLAANVAGWDDVKDADGKVVTPGIGRDVLAAIQQNPQGIPPQVWQQGMVAVAQFIDQWYGNALRYEAYRKQQAAMSVQGGEPAAAAAPRAARAASENSSGPATAAGGALSEDDIKASILASMREHAGGPRI